MFRLLFITIFVFYLMGCVYSPENRDNMDPFFTVVKLNSAESYGNRHEAEKYIDINQVYDPRKYVSNPNEIPHTPDKIYEQYLTFSKNIGKTNKFTSEFPYHNYEIRKIFISDDICEIEFISKEPKNNIIYILHNYNGNWIVIDILRDKRLTERNSQQIQK